MQRATLNRINDDINTKRRRQQAEKEAVVERPSRPVVASGCRPCGQCGTTISANKDLCRACAQMAELRAVAESHLMLQCSCPPCGIEPNRRQTYSIDVNCSIHGMRTA